MSEVQTVMGSGGRIVIPAPFRRALGLKDGSPVILRLEDGEVRLFTRMSGVARAQRILAEYVPRERSLARELIRERRAEASRE